jgi:hypothetical protein
MAASAKSTYLEYYHQIKSKLPSYSHTFRTHLKLIMDRIENLEFQPHQSWEDQCGISVEDSVQMIIQNIVEDIEGWEALSQQQTSISLDGNVSSIHNRKKVALGSIRYMEAEFIRDVKGLEPLPTQDRHSLLCHEVSEAPHWNNYMKFPPYMKQMFPHWDTKLEEDSPRFCVTATVTGNVTRAHHDDVSIDSRIMHVSGRKLWVLWDNSWENTARVCKRTIMYGKIDLQWLLDNLTAPKVIPCALPCPSSLTTPQLYFTADMGAHYFHYIFLPRHCWHLVFTFSTSFAISGSYHSIRTFTPALREIEEEISHLKHTTLMEQPEREYWSSLLTRNILQWAKYIRCDDVSEHIAEEDEGKLNELRAHWSTL